MNPHYIISKRWHLDSVGANGSNNWCIEVTDLNFDAKRDAGYQNPFKINSYTFRKAAGNFEGFPALQVSYIQLLKELDELPEYDEVIRSQFLEKQKLTSGQTTV